MTQVRVWLQSDGVDALRPTCGTGVVIDDTQLFNNKLQEWQDFYHYHRPHGALGGQTPYERLLQKTTTATTPE